MNPKLIKDAFENLIQMYPDSQLIFTDGSKSDTATAAAAVPANKNITPQMKRINSYASVYTAEACALDMALEIVENSSQSSFLILSDSLSCLTSLNQTNTLDPIILKLKLKIHFLNQKGKNVQFAWIPSHSGIGGNEEADSLAKETLKSKTDNSQKISCSDYKQYINKLIHSLWEKTWKEEY